MVVVEVQNSASGDEADIATQGKLFTNLHVWHPVLTLGLLALVFLILTSAAASGLETSPTCSGIRLEWDIDSM